MDNKADSCHNSLFARVVVPVFILLIAYEASLLTAAVFLSCQQRFSFCELDVSVLLFFLNRLADLPLLVNLEAFINKEHECEATSSGESNHSGHIVIHDLSIIFV